MQVQNCHFHSSLLLTRAFGIGQQTRTREEITYFPHLYQNIPTIDLFIEWEYKNRESRTW